VQFGAKLVTLGLLMVMVPIGVLVAFSLKAPPATWGVIELAIPIVGSSVLGLLGFLIHKANQAPPYYCPTCHRRYPWKSVRARWRIGSNVDGNVQTSNSFERTRGVK
jgi:hypothetical protein